MHKAMHKVNEIYLFTNLLEVLLEHGKTAMDLADWWGSQYSLGQKKTEIEVY